MFSEAGKRKKKWRQWRVERGRGEILAETGVGLKIFELWNMKYKKKREGMELRQCIIVKQERERGRPRDKEKEINKHKRGGKEKERQIEKRNENVSLYLLRKGA